MKNRTNQREKRRRNDGEKKKKGNTASFLPSRIGQPLLGMRGRRGAVQEEFFDPYSTHEGGGEGNNIGEVNKGAKKEARGEEKDISFT